MRLRNKDGRILSPSSRKRKKEERRSRCTTGEGARICAARSCAEAAYFMVPAASSAQLDLEVSFVCRGPDVSGAFFSCDSVNPRLHTL